MSGEQAILFLEFAPDSGAREQRVEIGPGERLVVGRDPTGAVVLDDGDVSREHSAFEREEDRVFLEDLSSRNGTFLSGERVTGRQEVTAGETIRFGPRASAKLVIEAPSPVRGARSDAHAPRGLSKFQIGLFAGALALFAGGGVAVNRYVGKNAPKRTRERATAAATSTPAEVVEQREPAVELDTSTSARPDAARKAAMASRAEPVKRTSDEAEAAAVAARRALTAVAAAIPRNPPAGNPTAPPRSEPPTSAATPRPEAHAEEHPPAPEGPSIESIIAGARGDAKALAELRKTLFIRLRHDGALAADRASQVLEAVRARFARAGVVRFVSDEDLERLREPSLKLKPRVLELRTSYVRDYSRGLGRAVEKVRLSPHPMTVRLELVDTGGESPRALQSFSAATPSLNPKTPDGLSEPEVWTATLGAITESLGHWNGRL